MITKARKWIQTKTLFINELDRILGLIENQKSLFKEISGQDPKNIKIVIDMDKSVSIEIIDTHYHNQIVDKSTNITWTDKVTVETNFTQSLQYYMDVLEILKGLSDNRIKQLLNDSGLWD